MGCHLALGWPLPVAILDLFAEFRNRTNGLVVPHGDGLLGALAWHGLDVMGSAEKVAMRDLAVRGGPWTDSEREALLTYCAADVEALARLLPAMLPSITMPHALQRGRYMASVARMEWTGVPIDQPKLDQLRTGWTSIRDRLIRSVDQRFGVFDGPTFRADRWAAWVARHGIAWPTKDYGALALDDDTFRELARSHPEVAVMRELRYSLSQLRLNDLAVGSDGRNRVLLSPFRSKTGRNQPSTSRFIFGPSCWLRGLIRPESDRALAYVDWSQQEFGIAAALSGDRAMLAAYESGDPYLAFGKQAGRIPPDGTKATHGREREAFKACVLGVQYGMGAATLAGRLGSGHAFARDLLDLHRRTYPQFWAWSDGAENHALLLGSLQTVFGWTIQTATEPNPRSLRNFPCQANGAEMLRWACSLATERGVKVLAPIHDALLVEGPADSIAAVVAETQRAMRQASEVVLDGFALRSDAKVVHWPDRYMDDRGAEFWGRVNVLLTPQSPGQPVQNCEGGCAKLQRDPCNPASPV